jgi:hypothetical protein
MALLAYRLRELELPHGVPGRLYLSLMPGRCLVPAEGDESFASALALICAAEVSGVVCLNGEDEVRLLAPAYAAARAAGALPWRRLDYPLVDQCVADDREDFRSFVHQIAGELRAGASLLVHCAAGIGRTGLCAASVLVILGRPLDLALTDVRDAGSHAQSSDQEGFLAWLADVEGIERER